jgi:NitT/TauT family transport system substrate-binding protein
MTRRWGNRPVIGRGLAGLTIGLLVLGGCASTGEDTPSSQTTEPAAPAEPVQVAALKGPTGMGLAKLIADQKAAEPKRFDITLYGAADEITPSLIKGDLPFAAVPVNLASVLYNKSEGNIQLAAINTLGVLYVVAKGEPVSDLADLAGKTVYSTGKGTTPEYVLSYLLDKAGVAGSVTVEYLSEASEVAARLAASDSAVAVLPEPYVTTVTTKDPSITVAIDLSVEWEKAAGSPLVTGALVVTKDWAAAHPDDAAAFLAAYAESVDFTNGQPAEAAAMIAEAGIVPEAAIAEKAIPRAHIVYLTGAEAKTAADAYLAVLFAADPAAVGGKLPDAGFYYAP